MYVSADCKNECKAEDQTPLHWKICPCSKTKNDENDRVKTNRVVKKTSIQTVGKGICLTEKVCIKKNGKYQHAVILYDKGSDATICVESLKECGKLLTFKNVAVKLADSSTQYISNAPVLELQLLGKQGKAEIFIEAMGVKTLTETKAFSVEIPQPWQTNFGLKAVEVNPEESIHILQGMDNN